MHIAERLTRIKPSATLTISSKAMDLRAQGREILSLSVGEPDFGTPRHICEAAKSAIDAGYTRYTQVPGIPELRMAVSGYFNTFYGVEASSDNVVVTNGGKQALYNLFQALLEPGDEVLIPAPYWVSYPAMVLLSAGVPVSVPAREESGFKVRIADLEKHLSRKTRMLLINSPSNPTGMHYSQAEIDDLAQWALDKGLFIVSDEIYDQLVFAPAKPSTLSTWWAKKPEQVAVVNGLAKSFAMTGWRVGYALAHPELIKAMSKIQGQSTSNICSIAQHAALAALTGPFDEVATMRARFAKRRDLLMDIVGAWPGVTCPRPDGAFYAFPVMEKCYTPQMPDSVSLCAMLLEKAGVATVPGAAFGEDRCIRISYAVSEETLAKGLAKVAAALGLHG